LYCISISISFFDSVFVDELLSFRAARWLLSFFLHKGINENKQCNDQPQAHDYEGNKTICHTSPLTNDKDADDQKCNAQLKDEIRNKITFMFPVKRSKISPSENTQSDAAYPNEIHQSHYLTSLEKTFVVEELLKLKISNSNVPYFYFLSQLSF
jgi:hypothetical protein